VTRFLSFSAPAGQASEGQLLAALRREVEGVEQRLEQERAAHTATRKASGGCLVRVCLLTLLQDFFKLGRFPQCAGHAACRAVWQYKQQAGSRSF
jgi:hypothetical protein